MRNSPQAQNAKPQSVAPQHAIRQTSAESFGRVARCTPAATPVQFAAGRRSANEADISSRGELEAMALRARAVNGFGDADAAMVALPVRPTMVFAPGDSPLLHKTAGMRDLVVAVSGWVSEVIRRIVDQTKRRQHARATYLALRELDARTLGDIGIHRSEILSVAAELGGQVEASRVQSLQVPRGR
jgi:uncharacterized protein YjiS (DUF1127 family)